MALAASPAKYPPRKADPLDPRWLDLVVHWHHVGAGPQGDPALAAKDADMLLVGIPFDGAVIGRKGARGGPTAIREATRYLGAWDPDQRQSLAGFRVLDLGDLQVPDGPSGDDVLAIHTAVGPALRAALAAAKPVVVLGGDNSLSYPTFRALHEQYGGKWGLIVIDAHYDLRPYEGVPTSGTPYRRILSEVPGQPVRGTNLVEVGIRAWANSPSLADFAAANGVHVVPMGDVRAWGIAKVIEFALARAARGVDHIMLSVDIDGLDQSIASGCSAPGAGGLTFDEAAALVRAVGAHPKCRAMDLVEVAPNLDPTGNTARTAAQLVATFAAGIAARK